MQHDLDPLIEQAKRVLDLNWSGSYTRPGPKLYPHQWSWDSAFVAIGYACYEQERAITELRHLFNNQWSNGLLPQIVFNPDFDGYFPGMSFWHAECGQNARCKLNTSGVVQPLLHATAALRVYRRASDAEGEGLVYIRHPWESGMDNSPMWDQILQRMQLRPDQIPKYQRADTHVVPKEDRPQEAAYDRFAYLVQLFEQRDYEEARIREDCPFLVQDVLFNVLLCQAEQDLAQIGQILGEDSSPHEARATKTASVIDRKLWDEEHGIYLDFDLITDQPIRVYVTAGFLPLYAGIPDGERAQRMLESLENTGFCLKDENLVPVPSYDRYGYGFSPVQYWRGPVWINIDWLLMRGFERYGFREQVQRLRQTIVRLVQNGGFHEYFDPLTGSGHGSNFFSWTAALLLDVLMDEAQGLKLSQTSQSIAVALRLGKSEQKEDYARQDEI